MQVPPHLSEDHLTEGMTERPYRPFILSPRAYRVIDGDTISVRAPRIDGKPGRGEAFRIRFAAVNAPEKLAPQPAARSLLAVGLRHPSMDLGADARDHLRHVCKDRAILVCFPGHDDDFGLDRYRRLLADVVISGAPGEDFELRGAFSAQAEMLDRRLASFMHLEDIDPPERVPQIVRSLRAMFTEKRPGAVTGCDAEIDLPSPGG